MCKRSDTETVKKRMKKFTAKEIEPFVAVAHRPGASNRGVVVASLGAALQKANGRWETHELSDEIDAECARRGRLSPVTDGRVTGKAVIEMKRRLLDALNRLREHYERVYVYLVRM